MKKVCVFLLVSLAVGICSVAAQDLIILRTGSVIEAQVEEISPTEIRYRRWDNLTGPLVVIPVANVLTIRYANGTYQIFTPEPVTWQGATQPVVAQPVAAPRPGRTITPRAAAAMNPDALTVGVFANAGGFLFSGPGLGVEFTQGNFNSAISVNFPTLGGDVGRAQSGIGLLGTLNYFHHTWFGGFYIGGGLGYTWREMRRSFWYGPWRESDDFTLHLLTAGVNLGWKFMTRSGFYFRAGSFLGVAYLFGDYADEWLSDTLDTFWAPSLVVGISF